MVQTSTGKAAAGPPKPWWCVRKHRAGGELPEEKAAETLAPVPSAVSGHGDGAAWHENGEHVSKRSTKK